MTSHAIYDGHYLKVHISIYALEVKMTEKDSRHGLNRLAEVPDKRNPRGKRQFHQNLTIKCIHATIFSYITDREYCDHTRTYYQQTM